MSQTNPNSWWSRATTDERLAQIDGGIELGMTARQIALNCGTSPHAIVDSANYHGRSLPSRGGYSAVHERSHAMRQARRAFLSGEPVDMWAAQ